VLRLGGGFGHLGDLEAIASTLNSVEMAGVRSSLVQGAADLRHAHLDDPLQHVDVRPDFVEKTILGDHLPRMANEQLEDAKGLRRQRDLAALAKELMAVGVEYEVAEGLPEP
jgi:recombinational DNA repair ATPase RecF